MLAVALVWAGLWPGVDLGAPAAGRTAATVSAHTFLTSSYSSCVDAKRPRNPQLTVFKLAGLPALTMLWTPPLEISAVVVRVQGHDERPPYQPDLARSPPLA